MNRSFKVGLAAVGGFVLTAGAVIGYWVATFDWDDCSDESCGLEWAAVVTWGLIFGVLIGIACGFAAFALTAYTRRDVHRG